MQCKSKSKASVTQHRTIASSPFGTFPSRKSFLLDRFPVCQSFDNDGYFLALDEEKRDLNCSLLPQPHSPPVLWSETSSYQIPRQIREGRLVRNVGGVVIFILDPIFYMPKIRDHLVLHPLVYLLLQSWVEKLRCLSPAFQGARRYFLLI